MSYMETKVREIGNSKGIIIPTELLNEMNLDKDSRIFITRTREGLAITAYDPKLKKQLDIAAEGMKQYSNALHALADK